MSKHAVIRTDDMFGTDNRVGIYSVKYFVEDNSDMVPTDIDNGHIVKVNHLLEGERELYEAVDAAANTPIEDLMIIATPELIYDERLRSLDDFYNKAGVPARAYAFHSHQKFSVTKDALDGKASPAVGDIVEAKAGTKMNVAASPTSDTTQIGQIAAIEQAGRFTFYVIEVR